jgi:endoribonuclease Dicer
MSQILRAAAKFRTVLSFLKSDHAMGAAAKMSAARSKYQGPDVAAMEEVRKNVEEKLKAFKERKINCLVSTAVLEEGMDVKTCNLVVRFQKIPTFR